MTGAIPPVTHVPAVMPLPLASRILGVTEKTLRRMVDAGDATPLPWTRTQQKFARAEVERLLGHAITALEMRLASLRHSRRKEIYKRANNKRRRAAREAAIAAPAARAQRRARLTDAELLRRIEILLGNGDPQ